MKTYFGDIGDLESMRKRRKGSKLKPLPYDPEAEVTRPVDVMAPTTGTLAELVTRAMPLTGEAWAANDVRKDLKAGNYGAAAAGAALGLLPFGGTLAGMKQAAKSFPMKLGGGDYLKRTAGSLPHAVDMPGFHWSPEQNLSATSPGMYGRGIKGAEAGRLAGQDDIRPRTFFYDNDVMRESGLGANQYRGTLKDVYPESDPLGFRARAGQQFPTEPDKAGNALERLIKGGGYKGYENRGMVSYFDPVPVAPHVSGTAIPEPKTPGYGITDTTEVMAGNQTGHMQAPGPMPSQYGEAFDDYQRKLMMILEGQNKRLYGAVDPAGEGAVTTGYYRTPTGSVETNPVYAHTLPYSAANEEIVGAVSPLNALMYGQNAYGYSGVAPGAGAAGLRTSIAGATPAQKAQASAILEDRGILATPSELGLTTHGFDPMTDARLLDETTRAFIEAGIPRAEALPGAARSGFAELPWGPEGAGTATEVALRPMLGLPPSAVDTLDRTGQFQQAARQLNAADRGLADRFPSPARQDLLTLREIVQKDGLAGLLNRVRTEGYKGLPAAGAMGIGLDQEEERKRPWW